MRLLLLGPNGQVGWQLQRALAPLGELIAPGRESPEGLVGDLERPEALAETVRRVRPDVVVNAAAYTAVDQAESEPDKARRVNGHAPGILAEEVRALDALLVHYSTDYVFDGTGSRAWKPVDPVAPINTYGWTKWEGEEAIRASECRHLIFRTSWVYARRGKNFMKTMLRLATTRDELQVVDDQVGAPAGADLIADVTAHATARLSRGEGDGGTYHVAPAGETSWHGYAAYLIDRARERGMEIAAERIRPVTSDAFPTAARRPGNSRLDCSSLEETFGFRLPDWRDGVRRTLDEIIELGNPGRNE